MNNPLHTDLEEAKSWKNENKNCCEAAQELNDFSDVWDQNRADKRRREPWRRDANSSLHTRLCNDA